MPARSRWLRMCIGLAFTAGFVVLFLRQVAPRDIAAALAQVSVAYLLAALALLGLDYALRILRWWWMLRACGVSLPRRACVRPFLVAAAVNNLLPLRAGDALRVVGFRTALRAPAMVVLGTVAIERLMDLVALLVVFFLGSLSVRAGVLPATLVTAAGWIAGVAAAAVLVVVCFHGVLEAVLAWLVRRPPLVRRGWAPRLEQYGRQLLGTTVLLREYRVAVPLLALSAVIWAVEGAVFLAVARALAVESAPAGPWFAMATGTLATLLPSAPGYVGTFDYFTMLGLGAHGAAAASAAGFAVMVHLVLWLPITLAGAACFFLRRPPAAEGGIP